MPRELFDEDGNPIEVPTEEELKPLQESAQKVADLEKQLEDINSDPAQKNWKEAREKIKKAEELKAKIKEQGYDIDESGKLIATKEEVKPEDIDKKVSEGTKKALFEAEKEKMLSSFTEDEKKVFVHYLDKLMTGEEQTISNLYKFAEEAEKVAMPGRTRDFRRSMGASGGAPRINDSSNDGAKKMASENFGIKADEVDDVSKEIIIK